MVEDLNRRAELEKAERKVKRRLVIGNGIWAAGGCASMIVLVAIPAVWVLT